METKLSTVQRPFNPMPELVRIALMECGLMALRPFDGLRVSGRPTAERLSGLDQRVKLEATQQKRLNQMLEELAAGDRYMKMKWGRKK